MKKFVAVLASFVLSTGITLANPNSADCGDDDVKPITISMAQQ